MIDFDLHVHSIYSKDSLSTIDRIIQRAELVGLSGIAICDHDTTQGAVAAITRAKELKSVIQIIPGIEVSTTRGHMLVLGVTEDLPPKQTPQQTIKAAQKLDGVTIAAHPFKRITKNLGYVGDLDIDAIETLNSRCRFWCSNEKAKKMAEELGKPQVGGSDAHVPEMVGRAYTRITSAKHRGILEAIREGDTIPEGIPTPTRVILRQAYQGMRQKFLL